MKEAEPQQGRRLDPPLLDLSLNPTLVDASDSSTAQARTAPVGPPRGPFACITPKGQIMADAGRPPWGVTTHLVTLPTYTRESVHPGSRDAAGEPEPSHLLGHHAPTVWAWPDRGCGAGGAGCSARRSCAGREQGAGGRRSIGGRGTLGGWSRPSV